MSDTKPAGAAWLQQQEKSKETDKNIVWKILHMYAIERQVFLYSVLKVTDY